MAEPVESVTVDAETVAAAWLHGTVEDARATPGDIEMESGNALVE